MRTFSDSLSKTRGEKSTGLYNEGIRLSPPEPRTNFNIPKGRQADIEVTPPAMGITIY